MLISLEISFVHYLWFQVQQGLEDKRGALKLLDDALSLSPRNALCRYHRAHLLFAQDRYEESLAELNELKQLAPKEPMVYFLAGKVMFYALLLMIM